MKHEALSPQQQTDFENAEVVAEAANEAFDRPHAAATELAEAGGTDRELLGAAALASTEFDQLKAATDTLMPGSAAFEAKEPATPIAAETVWNAMTPEQQATAAELRTAIAAGPLAEYGVSAETLRVVGAEVDGEAQFALIHTGPGIDIGDPNKEHDPARSYDEIWSRKNDHLFQVELNGVTYDTRLGMTDPVYAAKFADAQDRDVTLPDSKQLSEETGDDWTWTMLSGEPLTAGGGVPIRGVDVGAVDRFAAPPDNDYRGLRVCPAVPIG